MKNRIWIIWLFLWIAASGYAQSIEKLEQKLKGNLTDSTRIFTLIHLASVYQYVNIEKSISLVEEAAAIAEKRNWARQLANVNIALGTFYAVKGDNVAASNYNLLALNISIQLKDSVLMARSYNNLGNDNLESGKLDEAYFYFTQSYRMAVATNDSTHMGISLHNIGTVFKELGQYDRAINYLKLSKKISQLVGDEEEIPYFFDEMGDIYLRSGSYDSALYSLNYSLQYLAKEQLEINELKPKVLTKIAQTYLKKENYEQALSYYDSADVAFLQTGNPSGKAEVFLGRGLVYMSQKNFNEAEKLIERGSEIAAQANSLSLQIKCMEQLAKLYELKKDYEKSLTFFKKFKKLEDSLFSQGMQSKLLQDQVRFETESKDEQIKSLTQLEEYRKVEIKKQELIRNILVVVVALSIILLFTVYRSGQRRVRINRLLIEHQDEIKKRSIELEQLNQVKDKFFSIISHDLRSPINALSGILDLLENRHLKPEEFTKLTQELRFQFNHTKTLINNLLDWALLQMDKLKMVPERINLSEMVEENFKLLGSLHLKEISMINHVSPSIFVLADVNTLNLVFRNLILNGIKFTDNGGQITISCQEENNQYTIAVRDNGVGISEDVQKILFEKTSGYSTRGTANEKGTGLGLILCKEFVEKNGGRIWLESQVGHGSTFYFTLNKA